VSEVGRLFAATEGRPLHLSILNIAGPIQRYLKNGNPWMLRRSDALGGCMANLAPHFIDLAHWIAKSPVESVQGTKLKFTPASDVEEHGSLTITYTSGFVAHIQCGYTFPSSVDYSTEENREFYMSLSTTAQYLMTTGDHLRTLDRLGSDVGDGSGNDAMFRASTRQRPIDLQTDHYFHPYAVETLARFRAGQRPLAGMESIAAVIEVLQAWDAHARWAGTRGP
jgi:predicted dehydrogenase